MKVFVILIFGLLAGCASVEKTAREEAPPTVFKEERFDISAKPLWAFAGAEGATIKVRSISSESQLDVAVAYPEGARAVVLFENRKIRAVMFEHRDGDMLTITYDDDGDGLPERRSVFTILPSGEGRHLRAERFEWTKREEK